MQRDTQQRRAIRKVLAESGRPLAPDDVLQAGQVLVPSLGIATVYRSLKALVADGWLTEVELPGEVTRYELAARPHHHHFVCRECQQAFDIDACAPEVETLAPSGFLVEAHEVVLYGRCPSCAR